ncbi:hypothetical protein PVIIG_03262 [Plasmodium vivax India VII]|uniref:Uncharacterized protein n=2 Tax=Plasmodium vivax TaxID=5855 RepID=A0A0J9VZ55_PLAVI|nr:hypothetical protein PVIIG_03262 [Plasmodium vivax India VII]KMZ92948.1 hypothetical protein PVMG_04660 [Plasmodium vivax Mauritania I]
MKILRIDMLSTDSELSESNFYSDGQGKGLKRMEKKNTNWGLYNPGSDVDSDKEYFSDCFEAGTKELPNEGEFFNESDTPEEGKKCTLDNRAGDNRVGDNRAGDNGTEDSAACGHGDDDLTSDLENFQSFDLSASDVDYKRLGEKEKIFEQYKINIRTESDISFEEEKSFSHSIELSDNAEEVQSRPLHFYGEESNDKLLGSAERGEHSLDLRNDSESEVGERSDPFEGAEGLTRKIDDSNEEETEGERENHRKDEADVEEEPNDKQIDTGTDEQDGESESGNDTKFGETEKTVEASETSERGENFNYSNSNSKKEHVNKMSLTSEKRETITEGEDRPDGNHSFVLVGGVRDGNPSHRGADKAEKRGGEVKELDVAGKAGRVRDAERKPNRFHPQRNSPLFDYYSRGKNAQNGEWERNQDNQNTYELLSSSACEKSEMGDWLSSEPENGDGDGDDDEMNRDGGKYRHYQQQNFFAKERGPQCLSPHGKRNSLDKSGQHKIFLKSPQIRKQNFSEPPEQCRQSEKRNAPNSKADHYIYTCRQKSREGKNDFNYPNCYMPPKKPNLYGEKFYERRKMRAPRSVSKRSVGVQINLKAKKEYKKKGNTKSECYIPSSRRVKVKIPVFELKRVEIKNYDFDAVLVKDGRVVPRKKDPAREFLRAYISYVNER